MFIMLIVCICRNNFARLSLGSRLAHAWLTLGFRSAPALRGAEPPLGGGAPTSGAEAERSGAEVEREGEALCGAP